MSRARVLVVAPQPFYADRGTPIALRQVLEALSERGEQVDLLTYPVGEDIQLPGLRIFRIGNPFGIRDVAIGFSAKKVLLDLILVPAMWSRLRQAQYHCIHALEEAAFPALVLGRWHKVPVIYDMQSSLPEQMSTMPVFRTRVVLEVLRCCERWLIRKADTIVCSAGLEGYIWSVHPSARLWAWRFPGSDSPVSVEQIGQIRAELRIPPSAPVVVYTGNFAPYQGLSRLVGAASEVLKSFPDTVFVLVGASTGDDLGSSAEVTRLRESGALRLVSRQPRVKLPGFLAIADVLVSPREPGGNLPLKIFDYMAAGKPIVAVDSAAHRSVLGNENAVLVGLSSEQMGAAIVGLLRNPEEARRLGAAARAYSEANLSWKSFTELVSSVYEHAGDVATAIRNARPGS